MIRINRNDKENKKVNFNFNFEIGLKNEAIIKKVCSR